MASRGRRATKATADDVEGHPHDECRQNDPADDCRLERGRRSYVLISAKPPPMTSATKATMPQTSDPFRALLRKNRDCDRSGFEPFAAVSRRPGTLSDVEEAADRDGRTDGADGRADKDNDHIDEQHL